jgi:hypothetical protein
MKVVVTLEDREDGGVRAYSEDIPGFLLSNSDPVAVLKDIEPALEEILSYRLKRPVIVIELAAEKTRRVYIAHAA